MDTKIKGIKLTANQTSRLLDVIDGSAISLAYWPKHKELIVTHLDTLSQADITRITTAVKDLQDVPVVPETQKDVALRVLGLTQEDLVKIKALPSDVVIK